MRTWFFYWYWYEIVIGGLLTWLVLYYVKWYILKGEDEFVLFFSILKEKEKEMTMIQHTLLGGLILTILWNVWIWRYFYTPQNQDDIDNEIRKWF